MIIGFKQIHSTAGALFLLVLPVDVLSLAGGNGSRSSSLSSSKNSREGGPSSMLRRMRPSARGIGRVLNLNVRDNSSENEGRERVKKAHW